MNYDKLPYLMTRQEVADLIGVNHQFIARRESELGISEARVKWSSNRVRYRKDAVLSAFRRLNYIPDTV